ncbi:MAG TPA: zinc ribbon domain-containing protein [Planctomycetota bacterium]|nr:zinc ribbon domain-containing protein [Planctomycetota bacterium]
MILNCPFCAAKVRPADHDCPVCKQRMSRRCPSCSETIAANAGACKYCGEEVKGGKAPLRVAAPTPGIEFIEETTAAAPRKRKRCCGKGLFLVVLFGLLASAFVVRTDCRVCIKANEHQACISTTKHSVSHCERRVCRNGKTPLWVTAYESLGGTVKSCKRKDCKKAPSPDVKAPAKKDGDWD